MSADIDVFVDDIQTRSYARTKQIGFEQRALLILLRGLESVPGLATRFKTAIGSEFDLIWFSKNYQEFPVKLMSFKAAKAIPLTELVKRPEKTKVYKEFQNVLDNYGDTDVGIIFASDGDDMPELVMHDMAHWKMAPESKWRIELQGDLIIESLKDFIQSVRHNSGWQLLDTI